MRILILLLLALSAGCSTAPKSYGGFANGEPCVYVKGQGFICKTETTPEQQLAWYEAHYVQPYLDEREKQAIALCKPTSAADITTTYAALTLCSGVVELNPLFASMSPAAIVIVNGLGSWFLCEYFEQKAEKSPRAASTADAILLYDAVRGLAAFHNATTLASCL